MERIKEAIAKAGNASSTALQPRDIDVRQTKTQEPIVAPQHDAVLRGIETILLDRESLKKHRIVAFDARDPAYASYDMLRTRVAQVMKKHNWQTLAVTSPYPQTGKTTTAINLAISLARLHESKTVLVDFDLRKPSIANFLDIAGDFNISDVIKNQINISDFALKIGFDNLYLIPNKNPILHSSELIGSKTTSEFIENIKSLFVDGFIIFDLPPMLVTDDALSLLPFIDCILLVASVNETKISDLRECEQKIEKENYLGVVLNKTSENPEFYKNY